MPPTLCRSAPIAAPGNAPLRCVQIHPGRSHGLWQTSIAKLGMGQDAALNHRQQAQAAIDPGDGGKAGGQQAHQHKGHNRLAAFGKAGVVKEALFATASFSSAKNLSFNDLLVAVPAEPAELFFTGLIPVSFRNLF